jgi:hypothetical protein
VSHYIVKLTLGSWFLWEQGIRLRIGSRQWWFKPGQWL